MLSSGFYEWRHYKPAGAKKDIAYPYYISLPGKDYFYMAGIYQRWTDKETGETMNTFAIVTAPSNEFMTQIHNKKKRQPTILPEQLAHDWLFKELNEEEIKKLASHQIPACDMVAHTIRKDFREALNPQEPFEYSELPPIVC